MVTVRLDIVITKAPRLISLSVRSPTVRKGQSGQVALAYARVSDTSSNYKFAAGSPPSDRLRRRQGSFGLTRWWIGQMTLTLICFGRASSFFGNVTVSTPSLNSAVILAASTYIGTLKLRMNSP